MSSLLTLLETRNIPGWPEAPDPGPWPIVGLAGIALFITVLAIGIGLGARWLGESQGDSTPKTLPSGADAEILPSTASIEADRALAHHAAVEDDPRPDLPERRGKTDPLAVQL